MSGIAEGAVRINLRYVVSDRDRHGNVRLYLRRHGKKIRLRAEPGTPEFLAEYEAALSPGPAADPAAPGAPALPGTLRWLVERYYGSAAYETLHQSTRTRRRLALDALCLCHGTKRYAKIEPRHVHRIRDQWLSKHGPHGTNDRLKALRHLMAWAKESAHIAVDPTADVKRIHVASEGWHTWTTSEVDQYCARHPIGTKARLALDLLLYTGVRRCDVVKLGRQMETGDGWIHFVEAKGLTRMVKEIDIPILAPLATSITAAPSGHLTYLVSERGSPFGVDGFARWFSRCCKAAGLSGCTAHGLRKAGATRAAENGATEHQLMAIFGWTNPQQAAVYTRKASRKRLARDAMSLLLPSSPTERTGDGFVPPEGDQPPRWDKSKK